MRLLVLSHFNFVDRRLNLAFWKDRHGSRHIFVWRFGLATASKLSSKWKDRKRKFLIALITKILMAIRLEIHHGVDLLRGVPEESL